MASKKHTKEEKMAHKEHGKQHKEGKTAMKSKMGHKGK
jgi:hypothetical protein